MSPKVREFLRWLLLAAGLVCLGVFGWQTFSGVEAQDSYEDAASLAFHSEKTETAETAPQLQPPEETQPEIRWVPAQVEEEDPHITRLADMDLAALKQVNPDVIGWIFIPQTKVDYPLLQGEDNEYYLKNTWKGVRSAYASIFLEQYSSPDLTDFNTIVYGHNMNDGAMFGNLRKYKSQKQWEKSPYVYIATEEGVFRYDIFSAFKADVDGFAYQLQMEQDATRQSFLNQALAASGIQCDLEPAVTDRILTLSTCSGAGYTTRFVVMARLKMVQEQS